MNSAYSNHISRGYCSSKSIKGELTIYGTARPRAKLANENAMELLGQVRDIWPSIAPVGHVENNKNAKTFRKLKQKRKWKQKWKQKWK